MKAATLGKSTKTDVDEAVFGEKFHMSLVHEAARAELNARRRGTASTKTRGEVAMTGAKAWRQKGTGRARVGALSTPQRYGGGVAFGPKPRHYTVKVNKKAFRKALRAALSVHADRGTLAVFEPGDYDKPATKQAADGARKVRRGPRAHRVRARERGQRVKSFRNIRDVSVLPADQVGVADVIGAERLVLSPGCARGAHAEGVMTAREIVIRPVVSEKSYALLAANKYTFRVHDDAHKTQVRQAIEEVFGVRVQGVRTSWVKSKPKRRGWTQRQDPALEEGGRPATPGGLDRAVRRPGHRGLAMAIKKHKPTSPGRRFATWNDNAEVTKSEPEKALVEGLKKSGGRNTHGRITSRHRGGGAKRKYRKIDFKRQKDGVPAKVAAIEYDPNRSAHIALLHYADGDKRYILAPQRLRVGATVVSGPDAPSRRSATRCRSRGSRPARWSTTSS